MKEHAVVSNLTVNKVAVSTAGSLQVASDRLEGLSLL